MGTFVINAASCPERTGTYFHKHMSQYYPPLPWICTINLEVEREAPTPQEDGTDYGSRFHYLLPFQVEVEDCPEARANFEEAVLIMADINNDTTFGPEISDQTVTIEKPKGI